MPLTQVPAGMVATIVTSLEMRERPKPRPMSAARFRLARWKRPSAEKYRALFRRIGEPWLWFSRLVMNDEELTAIIHDDAVEIYAIEDQRGIEVGILELDFRKVGEVEL